MSIDFKLPMKWKLIHLPSVCSLTSSSVRIMLLNPILSLSPGSVLVCLCLTVVCLQRRRRGRGGGWCPGTGSISRPLKPFRLGMLIIQMFNIYYIIRGVLYIYILFHIFRKTTHASFLGFENAPQFTKKKIGGGGGGSPFPKIFKKI